MSGSDDPALTPEVINYDTYGIAVTKAIIDRSDKVATISFMRPIKALHPNDLDITEGQTYNVFISYGIFKDEMDSDTTKVKGMVHTGDI